MNESAEESQKLLFLFESLDGVHVRWIFYFLVWRLLFDSSILQRLPFLSSTF